MKELNKFKQLIIDKQYYDAHEALEEIWFPIRKTKSNYALVLKGFINGAVSLELFKRGKIKQSKQIEKIFLKYTTQERLNNLENSEKYIQLKQFLNLEFQKVYHNSYHLNTKHSYVSIRSNNTPMDWSSQPNVFKNYQDKEIINFDLENQNHKFIDLIAGVNAKKTYPNVEYFLRNNPSAGALYPIELYFQARGVDGFENGIYHYEPNKNAATFLSTINDNNGIEPYILPNVKIQGFVLLVSSIYFRSSWKYKNRAFRYCLLDAGHILGAVEASSYISSKECRVIYDFQKEELNNIFGLENKEFFLSSVIVGSGYKSILDKVKLDLNFCDGTGTFRKNDFVENGYKNSLKIIDKISQNKQVKYNFHKDVFKQTINSRRSIREFKGKPITKVEFKSIIDIVTQPIFSDCDEDINIFCIINNVQDMEKGLYIDNNYIKKGDFRNQAGYLCLEQILGSRSAVTIFLTTRSSNYQESYQKAGIIGHRFYLVCEYLGIGCSGIGAYYDDEVNNFIDKNDMVLYGITIGR